MGRGKIEIKKIENTTNRGVTFSKRKNGILKKASEISTLCDAEVSLIICSSSGKVIDYCSSNTSLPKLLEDYQEKSDTKLWDDEHENLKKEIDRIKNENKAMEIELRHLKGLDISSLHYTDLMKIERILVEGTDSVSHEMKERYRIAEENNEILEEEHNRLVFELQQVGMVAEEKVLENPYCGYEVKDDQSSMPFVFQPNLRQSM